MEPFSFESQMLSNQDFLRKLRALYDATNETMLFIGLNGTLDICNPLVNKIMDALHAIDGGHALAPATVEGESTL